MGDQRREALKESILLVDDTPANLRLLSQMLSELGFAVRAVTSGPRALASAQATPPDLILLDIRMPGMNGYEVCKRLKAEKQTSGIPIIFISALDETQDKVRAFALGGVDYVTKPFRYEEVLARVETHLYLRRLQRELQETNSRMERELALAGRIQAGFLPDESPEVPGWQLSVTLRPARETSGDFYDVIFLPNGRLGILVADVVDKGVGAALYMALSCSLVRTYAAEHPARPELVLASVNRRLLMDAGSDQFVTVFYGILDPTSGRLMYCNAGHNPPYLFGSSKESSFQTLGNTGAALGVTDALAWHRETVSVVPGGTLVLYTDGVTEAQDEGGTFFGPRRLLKAAQAHKGRTAQNVQEAVIAALQSFTGDAPQPDDITLMVLARNPSEA